MGGRATETLFALGAGDRVVGVDTSSVIPPAAMKLPKVGYHRAVSSEGVLSLKPDLIVHTEESGPAAALEQLRGAKVPLLSVTADATVEGAKRRLRTIGAALGKTAEAEKLVKALDADLAAAKQKSTKLDPPPKVLFLFARGGGALVVSGKGTAAHEMIELSGAQNAVAGYEGYRPLAAESAIAAAPDVIVVTSTRGEEDDADSVLKLPGLASTPAGKAKRVVFVDTMQFMGFGPDTGKRVAQFVDALVKARQPASP